MMATTHVLVGMNVALGISVLSGQPTTTLVILGAIGGLFPDLDVLWSHRRSLHFPVYASLVTLFGAVFAFVYPTLWAVGVVAFAAAAAAHAVGDVLGGGNEPRPWRRTCDRAVYNHYYGRWERPRRMIRYDGSPEDFCLAAVIACPAYVLSPPVLRPWVVLLVGISLVYTIARKPIGQLVEAHDL